MTWLVLFGSKFVILEAINVVFGDKVQFGGVIPFIVVVVGIMAAELIINRIYVALGNDNVLSARRVIKSRNPELRTRRRGDADTDGPGIERSWTTSALLSSS